MCVGLVKGLILTAGFSHQILTPSQRMKENSQQVSFHLVLPSTSSHEIFSENYAGKFTVMLPNEIQLDQKFHWEMALVELFWPKQDSVAVIENLWYETQGPNRRWKRTYVPSSAFLSMSSVFDYLRKIFKDKIDITDMNSNLFKVRLSNLLAKCMGFNMSLELLTLDDSVDEYAQITKVWEKSARGDHNHPQPCIEILFTPGQSLVSNEKHEDYSVPVFFHVQCSLASTTWVNGKFRNCLRTVEMNKNEEYKYLHHFVPKHILYVPVRVTSFREIHFDFTNDLNQTLSFLLDPVLSYYAFELYYYNHVKRNSSKYPFSLTVHMKNGTPLYLDRAIHLNGDIDCGMKN